MDVGAIVIDVALPSEPSRVDGQGNRMNSFYRLFQATCYAELWSVLSHSPNRNIRSPEFAELRVRQPPGFAEIGFAEPGSDRSVRQKRSKIGANSRLFALISGFLGRFLPIFNRFLPRVYEQVRTKQRS
jgi:hypothetical protein